MNTQRKQTLREIMTQAWDFVKKNGYTLRTALKVAWQNHKLRIALTQRIVKFYFQKVDGSVREAYGTLMSARIPAIEGGRKPCPSVQVYFDTEKGEWRCFKKANLMRMA